MLITVENPNSLYSDSVADALDEMLSNACGSSFYWVDRILDYDYPDSSNFGRLETDAKFACCIRRFCEAFERKMDSDSVYVTTDWEDTMMAHCGRFYDKEWHSIFASCTVIKPDLVILLHHKDHTDTQEFSDKRRALEERHAIFKSRAQIKGRPPTLEYHEDCFCSGVASTFKLTPQFINAITLAVKEHFLPTQIS